jgi:hypothetical protein
MKPLKEWQEQAQLVEALRRAGLVFFHVPNGELRNVRTAAKLKKMGASPGVPDLVIITAPAVESICPVVTFLEFKRSDSKGKLPDSQQAWRDAIETEGHLYILARGPGDAIDQLRSVGFRL